MQRPQEMLNTHAIAAMVRTINDLRAGPLTGSPPQMVVVTGDAIDNTQRNELTNFFALMDGGVVHPDSGAPGYDGVQKADWPLDIFWKPDGPPDGDTFQRELGFPRHPGLLDQAARAYTTDGLKLPWLRCYGNHEQLCQGMGIVTPALAADMIGTHKPVELPPGLDRDRAVETFIERPELFMSGACVDIAADNQRRPIRRHEFADPSYYVHDAGEVRFIALDTVCDAGDADGTIDSAQLRWLEEMLVESRDRFAVVVSHHGFDTLSNPRCERRPSELLDLLSRHPNVLLWLNGHTHRNRITQRNGFWEVTTSALVDWPCQARVVEIYKSRQGGLAIACTMLDHDGIGLAGLHRELAGNDPAYGFDTGRSGTPGDRNVVLELPSRL